MAGYISGDVRIDVVGPTSIVAANTSVTSNYVEMAKYNKAMFVVSAGTMDSSGVITLGVSAARSSTGSGAIDLGVNSTINQGAAVGGMVINKAAEVYFQATSSVFAGLGYTYVINGITYTAGSTASLSSSLTTGYFAPTRIFLGGTGAAGSTASEQSANHLVAYINHADYGVPGVIAYVTGAASSGIRLIANHADHHPDAAITITFPISSQAQIIEKIVGSVELFSDTLVTSSGFNYAAVTIVTSGAAAIPLSAVSVRSGARYSPNTTGLMAYEYGTT